MARKRKRNGKISKEQRGISKGPARRASKKALADAWIQERQRQMHGFWKEQ